MDEPITRLGTEECWEFLRRHEFGRLAHHLADEVHIAPVNYAVDHDPATGRRSLLFRTAEGSKLLGVVMNPDVAFEVDEIVGESATSIVLRGPGPPARGGRGAPRREPPAPPVGGHGEVERRRGRRHRGQRTTLRALAPLAAHDPGLTGATCRVRCRSHRGGLRGAPLVVRRGEEARVGSRDQLVGRTSSRPRSRSRRGSATTVRGSPWAVSAAATKSLMRTFAGPPISWIRPSGSPTVIGPRRGDDVVGGRSAGCSPWTGAPRRRHGGRLGDAARRTRRTGSRGRSSRGCRDVRISFSWATFARR